MSRDDLSRTNTFNYFWFEKTQFTSEGIFEVALIVEKWTRLGETVILNSFSNIFILSDCKIGGFRPSLSDRVLYFRWCLWILTLTRDKNKFQIQ